jgi:hypothetical protein
VTARKGRRIIAVYPYASTRRQAVVLGEDLIRDRGVRKPWEIVGVKEW